MVNPDNLALKIADLVRSGKVQGIADVRDDSLGPHRPAPRRGARAATLSPAWCSTTCSSTPSCRPTSAPTCWPWSTACRARSPSTSSSATGSPTRSRSSSAGPGSGSPRPSASAHVQRGLVKALDALDEVIALIRRSPDVEEARTGLMELLEIDEIQAQAILDMQLRRLAALERQKIMDRLAELERDHRGPRGHPGQRGPAAADHRRRARRDRREVRQRAPYPDHRGGRRPLDGGPDPRRGPRRLDHPRRLRQAHPRRPVPHPEARRQGRARRHACAATTSSSTSSRPPTTTGCCSSPPPAGSTAPRPTTSPRRQRDAKGGHVAGLLSFQPDE